MQDISVGFLDEADKSTITGWFLHKLDIFSLWAYIVLEYRACQKCLRLIMQVNITYWYLVSG